MNIILGLFAFAHDKKLITVVESTFRTGEYLCSLLLLFTHIQGILKILNKLFFICLSIYLLSQMFGLLFIL